MKYSRYFLLLAAILAPYAAHADKLSLVVNGKSYHSDSNYVKSRNIDHTYTCTSTPAGKIDPLNIPPDCREVSREVTTISEEYNENNTGYGFIYEFGKSFNYIPYVSAGIFRDSFNTDAKYISGGLSKRILLNRKLDNLHIEFGGVISVIDSPSYANNKAIVTFMPVLSIGTSSFGINLTYLPKISDYTTNVFFFQVETTLSR